MAYFGLAPRNIITGHSGTPSPQQARRSEASEQQRPGKSFPPRRQSSPIFIIQGAATIYMLYCKDMLPECQVCGGGFTNKSSVESRTAKSSFHLQPNCCGIVWALLTYGEKFDSHKAGVHARCLRLWKSPLSTTLRLNLPRRGR